MWSACSAGSRCCSEQGRLTSSLAIADKFVLRDDGGTVGEGKSDKVRITFDRVRLGQEECREYSCQLLAPPPMPDEVAVDAPMNGC